ncbi:uncharacterized protein LOC114298988 [Camellia sinensis]|uniref:uncharacterized protein LOC114298988 n=1 Tax=Camellia sinensis TaxID=4442 RepID=UPI001035F0E9|nr:uncharacterized protein LOC114298988 [Camellia sinensis]
MSVALAMWDWRLQSRVRPHRHPPDWVSSRHLRRQPLRRPPCPHSERRRLLRPSQARRHQQDIAKNHQVRKKYTIQLGENELVLKELDLLNEDANVYKLIGPVLVKQDLAEANANVRKRIDYISAELKRLDATLQDLEEKQNSKKDAILKLQQRIQSLWSLFLSTKPTFIISMIPFTLPPNTLHPLSLLTSSTTSGGFGVRKRSNFIDRSSAENADVVVLVRGKQRIFRSIQVVRIDPIRHILDDA